MQEVENIIGYTFKNKDLLNQAFIHSSYGNEFLVECYEKLEFLGDSVLSLVISEELMNHFSFKEGEMTKLRAYIVSSKNLSGIIENLGLDKYIKFGKSMKNQHNLPSVNGDIFESVLGAIYLDSDFNKAKEFVLKNIDVKNYLNIKNDYKTMLQEIVQGEGGKISYNTNQVENDTNFKAEVLINGIVVSTAISTSKKAAETLAAEIAIKKLQG